jgi:hypothetical protein
MPRGVYAHRPAEPFHGVPPAVAADDIVWCRTAFDTWVRRRALDGPRYDLDKAYQRVWLSVPTVALDPKPDDPEYINWPAVDVLPDQPEPPGPLWRNRR